MSGLGRKVFTAGSVLQAQDVMDYLMDQSVMVFAGTAARGSALGTAVAEGMVSYLADSDRLEVYTTTWTPVGVSSAPNVIINGAFDIWQRGTSIANTGATAFGADRWQLGGSSLNNSTISRQTAATTDATYGMRWGRNSGVTTATTHRMMHVLESAESKQFAGEPVTLSFRALRGANAPTTLTAVIYCGTGTDQTGSDLWAGWTGGTIAASTNLNIGTSVASYSVTANIPSSANQIAVYFEYASTGTAGANEWYQLETVKLESGSVATGFRRAANTLQGELAACQRYYFRSQGTAAYTHHAGFGFVFTSSDARITMTYPTNMRTAPSSVEFGNIVINDSANASWPISAITLNEPSTFATGLVCTISGATGGRFGRLINNNNTGGFIALSAEL